MPKITKRVVDAAAPDPAGRFYVWDSELKGFGLQVLSTGVKSYVLRYRTHDGADRRATIGKHGALTPEEARRKADEMRRGVRSGGDPLAERRTRRKAATIADVLDAYVDSETFKGKGDKTQAVDKGRVERHLKPLLGRLRVTTIRRADVERAFAAIRDGKTALTEKMGPRAVSRVRGGEGAARKSIRLLRAVFAWAMKHEIMAANPADGVDIGADGERDTILDDAAAYGRLFRTLERMEAEHRIRQPVADAIRVVALTGARRGEVAGLRWKHVDLKAGLATLPPAGHKTGKKTGKPRIIGLPSAAQAIISRQPQGEGDAFVFRPAGGKGPVELSKKWRTVRTEAGLPEDIGLHGLRHSLGSHMAMQGAQAAEIMTALGHRKLTTSQAYVHWAQSARQSVAEKAAVTALAGMAAGQGAPVAEVVPLKPGAGR
jgi:integrase